MQTGAMRRKIDKFRHPRFQSSRARSKENQKEQKRNERPEIEMGSVKLTVNHNAQRKQIQNNGGGDKSITEAHASQTFRARMIFSYGLKGDAPPKVSVNLDVPFIPTGVDRIAPAFFFEQSENRSEQMMPISSLITPKSPAPQTATFDGGRQIFMRANSAARCPFEMERGEVARKSANEWLQKSQAHHEQACGYGVEPRLNARPDHVGKRDRQRAAEHQIRHNSQRRQKNSQTEKEKRECEPFDATQIRSEVRLRRRVHGLKKSFAKDAVIKTRPIHKPTETRRAIDLAAPFRRPSGPKENQVLETQE